MVILKLVVCLINQVEPRPFRGVLVIKNNKCFWLATQSSAELLQCLRHYVNDALFHVMSVVFS